MRDFVSCFSENAVNISNPSCSTKSNAAAAVTAAVVSPPSTSPSVLTAVTSLYAAQNQLMISVSWTKLHSTQSLSINFTQPQLPTIIAFKLDTTARFFKKNKGSKSYDFQSSKIEIFYDLSAAIYDGGGPEPISGFYVVVTLDSEIGLVLGEIPISSRPLNLKSAMAADPEARKWSLISRTEHCAGNTLFLTKAKFSENGVAHEILIRCIGEEEGGKKQHPGLWVWIDKKAAIRVKRLQWNFRGNQSIFVDGLLVDMLWDVHDWLFGSAMNGLGVFMFRTRCGLESSRLWLEEEKKIINSHDEIQKNLDFSLLIYASKTS
ncbi:uncharacterized protein LOC111798963 [Cucurbita pepo subsp. pepo]|uniref:uncharacterized protein LOC111798963 n=1 Tax=Cucurbita pepo subsp. pepo TaxID=3664 RepID=UPI000C9D4A36|nr:uncharacterized protein LOC111798963 [Cucurbita pepo subsp. pepo]